MTLTIASSFVFLILLPLREVFLFQHLLHQACLRLCETNFVAVACRWFEKVILLHHVISDTLIRHPYRLRPNRLVASSFFLSCFSSPSCSLWVSLIQSLVCLWNLRISSTASKVFRFTSRRSSINYLPNIIVEQCFLFSTIPKIPNRNSCFFRKPPSSTAFETTSCSKYTFHSFNHWYNTVIPFAALKSSPFLWNSASIASILLSVLHLLAYASHGCFKAVACILEDSRFTAASWRAASLNCNGHVVRAALEETKCPWVELLD